MEGNLSEDQEILIDNSEKKISIDGVSQELVLDSQEAKSKKRNQEKPFPFPFQKVRKLMNCVCEESIRSDAIKMMMDATELFLQEFSEKTFSFSKSKNRKTLYFSDVADAINLHENLTFMKDAGILNETPVSPTKKSKKSSQSADINE